MAITSENVLTAHVKRAVDLTAAGQSAAQVAVILQAEGVPVPRQQVTHHALLRYDDGSVLPAEGAPGRWTEAKVTALLSCPETVSTGNYAAARAKLGSDITTSLTVV